jgi:transcription elongation GreA/GreB family factor
MRMAVEEANQERVGRYRLFLADLLYHNNLFADAAEQYELVPVPPNESPESKRYVGSLFMAGRYAKALQVTRAVRGIRSAIPDFSEIEARVNEASGSLDEANRLRRHLLEAGVTPALQRLKLAVNHFRRGQTNEAADLTLQVDLLIASEHPELLMEAARLRTLLNLPDALDFAHKLLHHEPDNPEVHLFFVQTFFRREEIDRQLLNPVVIGVNCTVTFRHLDEVQAVTVVAENADIAKNWFPVDHGLVKELLGKTVGDKIRIPPEDLGTEYEIRSVQSKVRGNIPGMLDAIQRALSGSLRSYAR